MDNYSTTAKTCLVRSPQMFMHSFEQLCVKNEVWQRLDLIYVVLSRLVLVQYEMKQGWF